MIKLINISKKMLIIAALVAMTGCGNNDTQNRVGNSTNSVESVLNEKMNAQSATQSGTSTKTQTSEQANNAKQVDYSKIDVDLTEMSSTMVYSEVNNMMLLPYDYIDKVVKMSGEVSIYVDVETQKRYYACIIADATACCSQGIEFDLGENAQYPEAGTKVTVVGKFGTYKEGEYTYCQLTGAELQ